MNHKHKKFLNAKKYFSHKADRYLSAMAEFPCARLLELMPISYLLPRKRHVMFDIMAGEGFFSRSFASFFEKSFQIEQVERYSRYSDKSMTWIYGDATDPNVLLPYEGCADFAVCLAGFHHVFVEKGDNVDVDETRNRRIETVRNWKRLLRPGGLLLVVDVPAFGCGFQFLGEEAISSGPPSSIPTEYLKLAGKYCRNLTQHEWQNLPLNLSEYLNELKMGLSRFSKGNPEPAMFFDEFVSKNGEYGHQGYFHSPEELALVFSESGMMDVGVCVAPTPWIFSSRKDALTFLSNLFAIRKESTNDRQRQGESHSALDEAIARFLGWYLFPDASCAVGWKLCYVWGTA